MNENFTNIKACVFDAYGTLLDLNSATSCCDEELGDKANALGELWRAKQLQYTWLRSLMGKHKDFRVVTENALDYAMDALDVSGNELRQKLLSSFEVLAPYEDASALLSQLRSSGIKTAILSNGSPDMLKNATENAGIKNLLDMVLSVEEVGIFKPDPRVYQLAVDRLETPTENICFVSANGWDVAGGAAFGFQVAWINRTDAPNERLGFKPKAEIKNLGTLAQIVLPV